MTESLETNGGLNPAREIVERRGLSESIVEVRSNDSIDLSENDSGWLVLSGSVGVFIVEENNPRRRPLYRVEAGGMVFGLKHRDLERIEGAKLIAVPTNGVELVPVRTDELIDSLTTLNDQGVACRFVDGIIDALLGTISDFFTIPISARRLALDSEISLSQGDQVFVEQGVHWIHDATDSFELGGKRPDQEVVPGEIGDGGVWIPVASDLCWSVDREVRVSPIDTSRRIALGGLSRDIQSLNGKLLTVGRSLYQQEDDRDSETILRSQKIRAEEFDASLREMVKMLDSRSSHDSDATQTSVARAIELVCRATGFALDLREGESIDLERSSDPVASIADRAGCLSRGVKLDGAWWGQDHGPMLAFLGESRQPVALIPRRNSKQYVLVEPLSGRSSLVNGSIAAQVASDAHVFFRALPEGDISAWKLVRMGAFGSRRDIFRIGWLILLGGFLSLVLPVVTGWIMDPVIPNAETSNLAVLALAIAITGVTSVAFSYVQGLATLRIEGRMQNIVQSAVWDRLLKLPVDFFRKFSVGDLVNRAGGIDSMRRFVTTSVLQTILHSVSILFSLSLMLYYDWRLSLAVILIALGYASLAIPVGFRFIGITRSMMDLNGRLQGVVLQLLTALQKIRIAGAEQNAFIHWSSRFSDLIELMYRQRLLNNFLVVSKSIIRVMTIAIVIAFLAWQGDVLFAIFYPESEWQKETARGAIPLSTSHFISFHVALGQFMGGAFSMTELWVKLLNLTPVYERIKPILTATEENAKATEIIEEVSGRIEFADVTFGYSPDLPPVLNGMSFTIEPQQMVALVGASGAGKSTVVRLLLGFEEPDAGSIYIDDKDLPSINKKELRRKIGAVLQESRMLSGSIFHNIVGGSGAGLDDAWEAARLAGIAQDIEAMPMGMQTFLGEGATNISGGQRQRIAAARALVRRPRLIVFDEATSALDNETQAHVSESIGRLNATRFVVAHRLSTIVGADQILVMDEGRIVESGSYEELLAREGFFAQLARRQIL